MAKAKCNKERVQLWVEALRSGKYKQGQNALRIRVDNKRQHLNRSKDKFCCLGVACEIARQHGVDVSWVPISIDQDAIMLALPDNTCEEAELPEIVKDWYGLKDTDPKLPGRKDNSNLPSVAYSCVSYNDIINANFLEIANALEKKFL